MSSLVIGNTKQTFEVKNPSERTPRILTSSFKRPARCMIGTCDAKLMLNISGENLILLLGVTG